MYSGPLQDTTCSQRQHEEETQDRGRTNSRVIERVSICKGLHNWSQCCLFVFDNDNNNNYTYIVREGPIHLEVVLWGSSIYICCKLT